MDLIFYHNQCPDGFCAALIAKKRYPTATFIGLNHGEPEIIDRLTPLVEAKDVLMVDFSLRTRNENSFLNNAARSFRIFDHHKTAQAELEGLDFATFDMNRSGAAITWDELFGKYDDYFFRQGRELRIGPNRNYNGMPEIQRPWYVDYVQDRDLYRHELPNSRAVNAYIMTLPFTEEAWRTLETMSPAQAAELGKGALAHVEHYVREIVEHRQMGRISATGKIGPMDAGFSVAVVNAPYLNISEIGNVLATDYADIGMGWFERGDGMVQFSLRSNGNIDVSYIAKANGGGGHCNAAGFQLGLKEARYFLDNILGRDLVKSGLVNSNLSELTL